MVPAPIELKRGMGASTTDRKICSTYRGGACSRSRSAAAAAALNDHRNLAAFDTFAAVSRAREARRFPGALRRSDLLEPPGRRCGCWRRRHLRFSEIVGWQILVRGRRWSSGGRCLEKNKAADVNRPCTSLLQRARFQRTSTRQQLDCAKTQ